MRRERKRPAFSLVEVVIALGVVSVALIGILALMSNSLREGRAAADDRVAVAAANRILAEARSAPEIGPVDTNYWFDADGAPLAASNASVYRIHAKGVIDTNFADGGGHTNLVRYQLTIFPVSAGANPPSPRVIHATVAR